MNIQDWYLFHDIARWTFILYLVPALLVLSIYALVQHFLRRSKLNFKRIMLVIGIGFGLAVLLISPNAFRAREAAQYTACGSTVRRYADSIKMYAADNEEQLPPSLGTLSPKYMQVLPTCPASGTVTYEYLHTSQAFTIYCSGRHHKGLSLPNYPRFSSTRGFEGGLER